MNSGPSSARLLVGAPGIAERLHKGDSVAVSGVCLTALEMGQDWFAADLTAETLARTTLGGLAAGSVVNLELPTSGGCPPGWPRGAGPRGRCRNAGGA